MNKYFIVIAILAAIACNPCAGNEPTQTTDSTTVVVDTFIGDTQAVDTLLHND